jgi:phosphotransferase system IIB component
MSCSTRTDGHTDMTKLRVAFHKFAKVPKNQEIKEAVEKSVDTSLLRQMTGM